MASPLRNDDPSSGVDEALSRIKRVKWISRVHLGPILTTFTNTVSSSTCGVSSSPTFTDGRGTFRRPRQRQMAVKFVACLAVVAVSMQVISVGQRGAGGSEGAGQTKAATSNIRASSSSPVQPAPGAAHHERNTRAIGPAGGENDNEYWDLKSVFRKLDEEAQSQRIISEEEAMDPDELKRKLDQDRKLTNERKLEEIRARAAMIGLDVPIPDANHPLSPNFNRLLELRSSTKNRFLAALLDFLPIGETLRRSLCQHFWAEETIGPGKLGGTWQEAYALRDLKQGYTADFDTQSPESDVAYVLPVTACPDVPDPSTENMPLLGHAFRDVVAMLKFSACKYSRNHVGNGGGGTNDYTMYAIVHPDAVQCQDTNGDTYDLVKVLEDMGYWVRVWGPPVGLEDLTDEYLQSYVDQNGGFRTYSAMQAYKLTNHPVGIFLNYDSMINNNIDSAIDYVASGVPPEDTTVIEQPWYAKDIDTGLGVLIPDPNAMFHRKFYGTSREGYHGISMDFTMFRPDLDQYFILKYYLQNGFYDAIDGWFGKGIMGMSFQGMLSWYYSNNSNRGEELDYCVYGNFFDPPLVTDINGNQNCQNEFESINSEAAPCTDCRAYSFDDVKTVNFAYCGPPWSCTLPVNLQCRSAHRLWFEMRKEFEELYSPYPIASVEGTYYPHIYNGYCTQEGYDGYTPMNYSHGPQPIAEIA